MPPSGAPSRVAAAVGQVLDRRERLAAQVAEGDALAQLGQHAQGAGAGGVAARREGRQRLLDQVAIVVVAQRRRGAPSVSRRGAPPARQRVVGAEEAPPGDTGARPAATAAAQLPSAEPSASVSSTNARQPRSIALAARAGRRSDALRPARGDHDRLAEAVDAGRCAAAAPGVEERLDHAAELAAPGVAARPHAEAQVVAGVGQHALAVQLAQHGVGDLGLAAVGHRLHAAGAGVDR